MTRFAWIGLGNMGAPMAGNLVASGHAVSGYDLSDAAREDARRVGVDVVGSIAEAVADADVVVTMLPKRRASTCATCSPRTAGCSATPVRGRSSWTRPPWTSRRPAGVTRKRPSMACASSMPR
ncbi:NAD(P)-binding domain-containing protein [Micrococcus luteus]|uniref:NAD(P)-binding domain-containing protein n=1 Tax=Micrococcus luteus TaxID=1270 RepID=UPI003B431AF4